MIRNAALILVMVLCTVVLSSGIQRSAGPHSSTGESSAPASNGEALRASGGQAMTAEQVQAMKEDLAQMKSLVKQMETNLSVVDTSQSPLKHQFQLEIDLWKVMIQRMERRLAQ